MINIPICTVLLPVYNNKQDILTSINSVIAQTFKNWEIIIIDDCSTDGTYATVLGFIKKNPEYPIRVVRNDKNQGTYVSLNHGLRIAKGTYISVIGSDDVYHPTMLKESIDYLEKNKICMAIYANYIRVKSIILSATDMAKFQKKSGIFSPSILVYRKKIIDEIGYYDSVRFAADSEFFSRIETKYGKNSIMKINKILYFAKKRDNSLTRSQITGQKGEGRINRNEYVSGYNKWHKSKNLYMPFPLIKRPFPIPNIMLP